MSSHREAPEISKDPVADNTDVYAFVSPDKPDTVTLIANFIPFQNPYGGPNFYEFGDDVLYQIHISNSGTARRTSRYQFRFRRRDPQQEDLPVQHRADHLDRATRPGTGRSTTRSPGWSTAGPGSLARNLAAPPVNIGLRSTPNYAKLAAPGDPHHRHGTARCSPASARTGSSPTSAASSTSARCGRSRWRT